MGTAPKALAAHFQIITVERHPSYTEEQTVKTSGEPTRSKSATHSDAFSLEILPGLTHTHAQCRVVHAEGARFCSKYRERITLHGNAAKTSSPADVYLRP